MRHLVSLSLGALCLVSGCAKSQVSPIATAPTAESNTPTLDQIDTAFGVAGQWTLRVDPGALSAEVELVQSRASTDNADTYLLPLTNFLLPDSLTIEGVGLGAHSLDIAWRFVHPFAASDDSGRADLGFSGMLVYLVRPQGVITDSYFETDGAIIADTEWVLNPDAYFSPGEMLEVPGVATTFPYQLLVDEGASTRFYAATGADLLSGIKYGDGETGWWSGNTDQWVDFDLLHQGQGTRGVLRLDRATTLRRGAFELEIALIAKYNDPKSATPGALHRLPSDPPDVLGNFAYRMPHGALDISQISYLGESGGLIDGTDSQTELRFHIRDWDARAPETTFANLADDPFAGHVAIGESGPPHLEISLPSLLGAATIVDLGSAPTDDDSDYGGDPEPDPGDSRSPLFYSCTLSKPGGTGGDTPGLYTGMLRIRDVEPEDSPYSTALDANLVPLPAGFPPPVTYQRFQVRLEPFGGEPGWAIRAGDSQTDFGQVIAVNEQSEIFVAGGFDRAIDFGGGTRTVNNFSYDIFLLKLRSDGTYMWDRTWGGPLNDDVTGIAFDSDGHLYVSGSYSDSIQFDTTPLQSQGVQDAFLLKLGPDGSQRWVRSLGSVGSDIPSAPVVVDMLDRPVLAGYVSGPVDFGTGPHPFGGSNDPFIAIYSSRGTLEHGAACPASSGALVLAVLPTRLNPADFLIAGGFLGSLTLPGAAEMTAEDSDSFVAHYSSVISEFTNVTQISGPLSQYITTFAEHAPGSYYCAGVFETSVDFGDGPTPEVGSSDFFLAEFDETASVVWSNTWGSVDSEAPRALVRGDDGAMHLFGITWGDLDFGQGPLGNDGLNDIFWARFEGGPEAVDSARIGGNNLEHVNGAALLFPSRLVYTGALYATTDFDPGPGDFSLTSVEESDLFVATLGTDGEF